MTLQLLARLRKESSKIIEAALWVRDERFAPMIPLLLMTVLAAGAADTPAPAQAPWTWSGIEILGNHHVPRAEIEKLIPVPIGGPYSLDDPPFWKESCAAVERTFGFAKVECGERPLRVFDGRKAYLIVDVVERGNERFLAFRAAPRGTVPFRDPQIVSLSDGLGKKTLSAAMAGHPYRESGAKGYLSYTDETGKNEDVTPLVEQLARLVPPHRDNLFDVLRGEQDAGKRQSAANLLNWSGRDLDDTIREAIPLLDDPDAGVRNNLSRFMIQFVGKVRSKRLRRQLIDAFVFQIQRPGHGDRNKGLYDLLAMAKESPEDRWWIRRHGIEPIRYLARNSIVFNVKGPAEELLALVSPGD